MLEGQVGSWLSLPGGVSIARLADSAEVTVGEPAGVPGVYELPVPGRVVAVEFGVHLTAEEIPGDQLAAQTGPAGPEMVVLDRAQVGDELVLRGPRPGDRFAPAGMGGRTKTVAEYLSDEKVPRHRRPHVPVLATGEGAIVWIVGMRGTETAKATAVTTRAIRVVARRLRA